MDSGVPHGVCFAVVAGDKSGACFEQEVRQETGAQAAGYGNLWHVTTGANADGKSFARLHLGQCRQSGDHG